ncbi:MAG: hypothetical protein CMB80_14635 [Flammeovirgaceae bacterium]|nr:hypothetical protein [Flammeovirgaceae bacterium]|tara:strand:- start:367 stop:639 length:273 start_codon:yes stop_codon:yes gene_type:complete
MTELVGVEVDVRLLLERVFKYFVEGAMVALAAFVIPSRKTQLNWEEIAMIALTAAATFAILDMYASGLASSARQGVGFGIGANLVKFPHA